MLNDKEQEKCQLSTDIYIKKQPTCVESQGKCWYQARCWMAKARTGVQRPQVFRTRAGRGVGTKQVDAVVDFGAYTSYKMTAMMVMS